MVAAEQGQEELQQKLLLMRKSSFSKELEEEALLSSKMGNHLAVVPAGVLEGHFYGFVGELTAPLEEQRLHRESWGARGPQSLARSVRDATRTRAHPVEKHA
jgi:hypothetical protein